VMRVFGFFPASLSDADRRELGLLKDDTITLTGFESLTRNAIDSVYETLSAVKSDALIAGGILEVSMGDTKYFRLQRGRRVTRHDCIRNPGEVPVISGRGRKDSYLGLVSEKWAKEKGIPVEKKPLIVIAANGNVGSVFLRDEPKYIIHDDAIGIETVSVELDPLYIQFEIRRAISADRFQYDAKLYQARLRDVKVRIPVKDGGLIDMDAQRKMAERFRAIEDMKARIEGLAKELQDKVIVPG